MSACFEDKHGLNFLKFLRCVTGYGYHISVTRKEDISHLTTTKKEGIPVKK